MPFTLIQLEPKDIVRLLMGAGTFVTVTDDATGETVSVRIASPFIPDGPAVAAQVQRLCHLKPEDL